MASTPERTNHRSIAPPGAMARSPSTADFGFEPQLLDGRHSREILDRLPIITWACDGDGHCYFLSQRWAEYTGIPCEQQLGFKWIECLHPDDRAATQGAEAPQDDYRTEYRVRRHDGEYRWFAAHGRPVKDAQGNVVRWFGCTTDIHEARAARAALAEEHQLLERIIATAPGTFFMLRRTAAGVYQHPAASPNVQRLLGASPEQLARDAEASLDRVHPADRERVRREIEESARTLAPWTTEHRFLHPIDGELWIEPHALPVREPDGAVTWYGFVRDVTERRKAEASLRATQEQLVAALEAGGMGIWRWNMATDELWLDDAFLKLLRQERRDSALTSADVFSFVHPDDVAPLRVRLDEIRDQQHDQNFEYRIVRRDGQVRLLSATAHCRSDEGSPASATVLHIDVTEQKRSAESQLRSQKLEALGTLAGGIAHDFNNMLHAISGNTSLALRMLEPAHPARSFLDAVSVAGARASDLVRRILAFSRPGDPRSEVLSLQAVVREALALVRAAVPASIELRTELGDDPLCIDAESTQIHQIVLNLATNSAHAIGGKNGLLYLQLARAQDGGVDSLPPELAPGRYAVLKVSDTGCGMSAETMSRIFDPFFTTKAVGQGTGLGLSVVHGIMKSLGGTVTVTSKLGAGTTFTLYFPTTKKRSAGSSRPPPPIKGKSGGRVLFVDDELILVELGIHTLEALGYEAVGRQRPREALRELLQEPLRFDVLVTDIAMPELSGFDLVARVREHFPNFPIIMMSGNVGPEEVAAAGQLGVRDVLLKPVDMNTLNRALGRARRTRAAL